ncbi:amidohydrolase family protein [Caulobacter sp. 17J65-9]|uniref:amidohydrolase family protein n=1 Tax=Caulobacter sp. 17J65-9 TaxID=2709382 RepID=UPI0013CB15B1|nr:amidohydrolase family protein [Caulobacter sp. 17J65-9]NEX92405.1 amidohydrolase family protein [Caulobacter sp. 17J65-9]
MSLIRRVCLGAVSALALCAGAGAAAAEPHLYYGVTLVDPEHETTTANAWLVVDDGKIVRMGTGRAPRAIPADRRHDFTGRYALPGLFDTHAHVTLGPLSVAVQDGQPRVKVAYDPQIVAYNGRMLLAYGVTTVRDPGGDTVNTTAYARDQRAGRILGPEALVAGLIIDRSPVPLDGLVAIPTADRSVAVIAAEEAAAGVDYVKLYTTLNEQDLAEGIAAAKAAGVRTIGHLEGVSWTRAAELGIDSLVHAMPINPDLLPADRRAAYVASTRHGSYSFFEWYEAVDLDGPEIRRMIDTLAERKVEVDATLIAFYLAFWGDDPAVTDADAALAYPSLLKNWRSGFRFDLGWKADDYRRAKAVWPKVLKLTRMMHEAGVPLTIGTDMANPFLVPGASLGREMKLHADAGISNWAILRMATSDAARALRVDDRTGRLAPGWEADVVFLKADPVRDVAAVGQVEAVLSDGRLLWSDQLKAEASSR